MRRLALLLLCSSAWADLGPKPTEDFRLVGAGSLSVVEPSALLQCSRPDCSDAAPLGQVGPQHFSCGADRCSALAYGFSPYQKLSLSFSDGRVRESAVFPESKALEALYEVVVGTADLAVREETLPSARSKTGALSPFGPSAKPAFEAGPRPKTRLERFPRAAAATLALELLLAAAFALRKGVLSARFLLSVLGANLLSLPVLWFVLPLFVKSVLLQELCVWLFEAAFVYGLNRGTLTLGGAAGLALALNLASALCDFVLAFEL